MMKRPAAIAFDVIETLFPIEPLAAHLPALGLPEHALTGWFAASLRDFFALGAIGTFQPLRQVMASVLDDLAARAGAAPAPRAQAALLDAFVTLPAHPEAAESMDILRAAGVRLVALSNGGEVATNKLIQTAGLRHRFDSVVSVEHVHLPKPRREVYLHAAGVADVPPGRMMLVATHPWDINGARSAGLLGGFIARGRPYPAYLNPPTLTAPDLVALARLVVGLSE